MPMIGWTSLIGTEEFCLCASPVDVMRRRTRRSRGKGEELFKA
jgi:hypothetical protein